MEPEVHDAKVHVDPTTSLLCIVDGTSGTERDTDGIRWRGEGDPAETVELVRSGPATATRTDTAGGRSTTKWGKELGGGKGSEGPRLDEE